MHTELRLYLELRLASWVITASGPLIQVNICDTVINDNNCREKQ
jgi:hypothetical protein